MGWGQIGFMVGMGNEAVGFWVGQRGSSGVRGGVGVVAWLVWDVVVVVVMAVGERKI